MVIGQAIESHFLCVHVGTPLVIVYRSAFLNHVPGPETRENSTTNVSLPRIVAAETFSNSPVARTVPSWASRRSKREARGSVGG